MDEEVDAYYEEKIKACREEQKIARRQMILWSIPNAILWSPVILLSWWFGLVEWLSKRIYEASRGFRPITDVPKIGGDRLEEAFHRSVEAGADMRSLKRERRDYKKMEERTDKELRLVERDGVKAVQLVGEEERSE